MNQVGTIIDGRYELLSVAGEGGMATVYKAKHLELDDIVAIKILSPDPQDQQRQQRFLQEARLVADIQHPNVCGVKTFGICPDGNLFIVMEYMSGKSLAAMVAESGGIEPETAVGYFKQICAGLSAAHKLGIIHRDLKPSNIMVNNSQAKILDFGIARSTTQENQNLTRTGVVIGSPDYMSPEQCMAKPTDKRSDIYSLGCLMYECIVGQPPFRSDSEYLTMSRQLSEALPENLKLSSYPQLDGLIKRCLEKNPDKRFADVADLTLALDNLELSKTPTTAPRTQRTLIGGLCALVVAGLATTGVKLWQNHRTQPVAPFSVLDVQAVTNSWLDHNEQASTTEQRSMLLRECIIRQKSNPRKAYDIYRVYGLLCTKGSPSRQDLADMEAFYQSSGGETSQAPGWQHNLREVHACRAACMTHLGRLDDAVLEYRKALTHAQHNKETLDDFVLHRTIGQTLMEQKRYDAALKEFELMHTSKCAGDNPKRHLQAYCLEGAACMALNKLPEARKKLDTAKEIVCEICSSPTDLQPAETALTLARMFRTLGSSGELGAATVLVQRATMLRETYKPTPANVAGYVDTCVFAAEVIPGQWPVTEVTEFYSECWARLCRMTLDQSPRIRFLEGAARAYSQCQDRKGLNWVQEQLDKMAPRSAADLACAKRIKELCKQ